LKKHIRINGGQYPVKFDVFLGYGNRDKPEILRLLAKNLYKSTYNGLADIIQATDIDVKAGWHFAFGGVFVVVLPVFNVNIPHYYGILHHELEHNIRAAGRHLHFRQSEECEEFYCYLSGHLTERIYRRLW
jgi:hypothetical protein